MNIMKRLIAILLAATCMAANARPVGKSAALGIAKATLPGKTLIDLTPQLPYTQLFVFGAESGGFAIVSADDCAGPLLAWSPDGTFRADNMPGHVAAWLEGYDLEVQRLSGIGKRSPCWDADPATPATALAPMLTTTWDQNQPYNIQCPSPQHGARPPAGCVAIATAQIMKYWNHPDTGYGSRSYTCEGYNPISADFGATAYDWPNMPNQLTSVSSSAEANAVAQLVFHIGVAVEMEYAADANSGSSATSISFGEYDEVCAENAMKYNFKYSPLLHCEYKADYSDSAWQAMLHAELDAGRPVYYTGRGGGGHAFVCDGYDDAGLFHMNWGWGGYCDGYYAIGALNPSSGGTGGSTSSTYNLDNRVIVGIEPLADSLWGLGGTITVTNAGNGAGTVSGTGSHAFGDTVQLQATAIGANRFDGWTDGYRHNPRTVVVTGGDIGLGARFTALGGDTLGYCGNGQRRTTFGRGADSPEAWWGIRLPASLFNDGRQITATQFFVDRPGTFDVTVYCGASTPTVAIAQQSATIGEESTGDWYTFSFDSAATPAPGQSVWVVMHSTDIPYPATATYSSGNQYAMLWGSNYQPSSNWRKYSYMVRAITAQAPEPHPGTDTTDIDTTGIDIAMGAMSIVVSPNPASDMLTVECAEGAALTLIDMSGRELMHATARSGRTPLDVSRLPQGSYLLRAATDTAFGIKRITIIHRQ